MKVENMEVGLLELWVALAMGETRSTTHPEPTAFGQYWLTFVKSGAAMLCPRYTFAPNDVMRVINYFKPELYFHANIGEWSAACPDSEDTLCSGFGRTIGEAVARAVVLARFGEDPQLDTEDEPVEQTA